MVVAYEGNVVKINLRLYRTYGAPTKGVSPIGGTQSSNPPSSTGESANLRSPLVAVAIGGIEVLGLAAAKLGFSGGLWDAVNAAKENIGALGYVIIAIFVANWLVSFDSLSGDGVRQDRRVRPNNGRVVTAGSSLPHLG